MTKLNNFFLFATTMAGGKQTMKERLMMLATEPQKKGYVLAGLAMLMIVVSSCAFGGAVEEEAPPEQTKRCFPRTRRNFTKPETPISATLRPTESCFPYWGTGELGDYTLELETEAEPYVLRVVFSASPDDVEALNSQMFEKAVILLALIDNAAEIQWRYTLTDTQQTPPQEVPYTVYMRAEQAATVLGNGDIKGFGASAEQVQAMLDLLEQTAITPGKPAGATGYRRPLSGGASGIRRFFRA